MARSIWKGHISFGLVNVPVTLYSAEQRADLSFHMIDSRDNARIRYERVNEETKTFARGVAVHVERFDPKRYVATMSKAKRRGRIYVDYLRNGRGATSVAPYSPRARAGAPVSTPIRWNEVDDLNNFAQFTVANLPKRLKTLKKDPWVKFFELEQRLTATHLKAMGGEA